MLYDYEVFGAAPRGNGGGGGGGGGGLVEGRGGAGGDQRGSYAVTLRNNTGKQLTVFVHYRTTAGEWRTRTYSLAPRTERDAGIATPNRIIYFRAEGNGYLADGGAGGERTSDGRRYHKVDMGERPKTWSHVYN
jgi:hypothetical protein